MAEQDGGLIGAEEKVINSKNKMDENMVSHLFAKHISFCTWEQVAWWLVLPGFIHSRREESSCSQRLFLLLSVCMRGPVRLLFLECG